ncbi:MAG: T9SS type A sorting domain-containing protein [bacterium]
MKHRMTNKLLWLPLAAALLLCTTALAQSGEHLTSWMVINAGGGERISGNNHLFSQFGQAFNHASASPGGKHVMVHGWAGLDSPPQVAYEVIEVETPTLPDEYSLAQNYPNPFNPTTVIEFSMPRSGNALLEVYDIMGRRVITLADEYLNAGLKQVVWDGRDRNGHEVASGMYLYRLQVGDVSLTKKMILLK